MNLSAAQRVPRHRATVAAYQMPVTDCYSADAVVRLGEQVRRCESAGVDILCCPEGALGGLADYVDDPASIAISANSEILDAVLAPLASTTVTTILGFTEMDDAGRLYNTAAVFQRGAVVGLYRKRHPAIRASRYSAGADAPLFTIDGLTFGVLICRDSLDAELARDMVERGATALFVPTNNAMPRTKGGHELVTTTRELDVRRAAEFGVDVIRADVVGETGRLVSYGCAAITDRSGRQVGAAGPGGAGLLLADIGRDVNAKQSVEAYGR